MFRRAEVKDYNDIIDIRKQLGLEIANLQDVEYKDAVQNRGFLLNINYPQETFEADLNKIFIVYEENGRVKGFIRIDEKQELGKKEYAFWYQPNMADEFFSFPHACIGGIAVLPNLNNKGVGTRMLNMAINELRIKNIRYLFSYITTSPVTNFKSIKFHEKNGFVRIALENPTDYLGMKNYQGIIFSSKIASDEKEEK